MFISRFKLYIFMGQQDVYNFFKAHPNDWFTSREMSFGMNQSIGSITVCLMKLRNRNDINYKQTGLRKGRRAQYFYKFKI